MVFWGWHLGGVLNTFFPTLRSEGWWFSLLVKSQSWWSKASMQLWREGNYQPHCSFWEAATFSSKCSVGWCKPLSISKVLKTLIEIIFASIFIAFMKAKYFFFHLYCFRDDSWIWFWQEMQDYLFFFNGYACFLINLKGHSHFCLMYCLFPGGLKKSWSIHMAINSIPETTQL